NSYHGFWNCNNYPYYNTYYNPYYTGMVVYTPSLPVYNRPRTFNLNTYNSGNQNYPHGTRVYSGSSTSNNTNNNNYRGSGTNAGQFLRNVFNSGSSVNNSNSSNSSPRTNTSTNSNNSSSSNSSGSSSSSSGHASVRRF
ncbi:MAG TPA: hypothetical protein VFQ58_01085, partial [Flavisolibacter sp.]|nr:hypothetical protein [Flavisolibacter sp.]